jgi:uncharacterized membrane protein (UPF0127 family)
VAVAAVAVAAERPPVSSASAERCERLDALEAEELPGGLRLAYAKSFGERARGLARLDAMPAAYALHIPRCRSVHTFTMRFPLDLIWLAKDGTIVRVDHDVPPNRHKACRKARSVIEANAGEGDAFAAALARPAA